MASTLLITLLLWTAYLLTVSADQLYLRERLGEKATLGSKWRIVLFPGLTLFVYLILGQAEKYGVINTPDKDPPSPEEARRIAATLRALLMGILTLITVGMASGGSWSFPFVLSSMLLCFLLALTAVLTAKFLSNLKQTG